MVTPGADVTQLLEDEAGNTVEVVRYLDPPRDVLVCRARPAPGKRWKDAPTLGTGFGRGEVRLDSPTLLDDLERLGIVGTLRPVVFDTEP